MPKAKMKFPPIPGETPREKFENLVRVMFSTPKEKIMSKLSRTSKKFTKEHG
jgi:hypothetical protein